MGGAGDFSRPHSIAIAGFGVAAELGGTMMGAAATLRISSVAVAGLGAASIVRQQSWV
jgi:hypothetical protein